MSENQRIITALSALGLPVEPDIYTGNAPAYIIFNFNAIGGVYGDDLPLIERHLIQIHLIAPHAFNSIRLRGQIRSAMLLADYTYSGVVNASDADGQHFVFEFEAPEGIEING